MHDHNLYTLYPWVDNGATTIVCNWREKGLHFSGGDAGQDYPLTLSLSSQILTQDFIPYVDWGLAFYHCLTEFPYGGSSNQILAIVWGQKRAMEKHHYLRLSSKRREFPHYWGHLMEHWDELFDKDAIPHFRMDGLDDDRCADRVSMENTYLDMLHERAANVIFPIPRKELREKVEKDPTPILLSVHGRSMDGQCPTSENLCTTVDKLTVLDTCDYSEPRIRDLFNISNESMPITLFTDGQDEGAIRTYKIVDKRPFFEQLWAMVLSQHHIGNPKSSMDFLIHKWRRQLGIQGIMEPTNCYA